ncbi:MAG: YceI family protein [Acidimicrobiales bacterium]
MTINQPTTGTALSAGIWTLNPRNTSVTVAVRKLGFINVAANLALTEGTVTIDANGQVVSVAAAVDAASYDSGNPKRDTHVLSEDFLDTDHHPEISFTASRVEASSAGYQAAGELTLKGKTTPITLEVGDLAVDGSSASFVARTTVDRKELGVDKMPSFVIGNALQLTVSAQATLNP